MFQESDVPRGRLTREFDVALFIQENATKEQNNPLSFTKPCTTHPVQLKAKQLNKHLFRFACGATEICVTEESRWIFKFPLKRQ